MALNDLIMNQKQLHTTIFESKYTPAWQQRVTGIKPELVTQVAREFAQNAIDTKGRSMIIMGLWY